jgi:hypothetical protein
MYTDEELNKWLVIKATGAATFGGGGDGFTKRAIIINESNGGASLPNVTSGNILFYIPPEFNSNLNFNTSEGQFRGMIYNASQNAQINITPLSSSGWTINGAFYNVGKVGENMSPGKTMQFHGGYRVTINYDKGVMCDLANLGIFGKDAICDDDNKNIGTTGKLQRIPPALFSPKTDLLSREF